MEMSGFSKWMKENDIELYDLIPFDKGYEEGVVIYWREEEGKGNPYEANTLNWFLFEEGKAQAGQDV